MITYMASVRGIKKFAAIAFCSLAAVIGLSVSTKANVAPNPWIISNWGAGPTGPYVAIPVFWGIDVVGCAEDADGNLDEVWVWMQESGGSWSVLSSELNPDGSYGEAWGYAAEDVGDYNLYCAAKDSNGVWAYSGWLTITLY